MPEVYKAPVPLVLPEHPPGCTDWSCRSCHCTGLLATSPTTSLPSGNSSLRGAEDDIEGFWDSLKQGDPKCRPGRVHWAIESSRL
jgi:hypothetical protein